MKKRLLSALTIILCSAASYAQKTEFSLQLTSGLSSFGGESAAKSTWINSYSYRPGPESYYNPDLFIDRPGEGYTNNPYGKVPLLAYGLSAQVQRVGRKNNLVGFGAGYEVLGSKINITSINSWSRAEGQTTLCTHFINLNSYLGRRFYAGVVSLDLTAGFDLGIGLKSQERGQATEADGSPMRTSLDRDIPPLDVRPRLQLSGTYRQVGLYAGYSYGLTNYSGGLVGANRAHYARVLRFGLSYTLNP